MEMCAYIYNKRVIHLLLDLIDTEREWNDYTKYDRDVCSAKTVNKTTVTGFLSSEIALAKLVLLRIGK